MKAVPFLVLLCACTDDVTVVRVNVSARATLQPVSDLRFDAQDGAGHAAGGDFRLAGVSLPTSFTVTPSAGGPLTMSFRASNAGGDLVGRASGSTNAVADTIVDLDVMLEPEDFRISRDDQRGVVTESPRAATSARQLAAGPGGFAAVWSSGTSNCIAVAACTVRGMRLDGNTAVQTPAAGGSELKLSDSLPLLQGPSVAVGGGPNGYLAVWDASDGSNYSVWAVNISPAGVVGTPFVIAAEPPADCRFPSVLGMTDGSFVVLYDRYDTSGAAGVSARMINPAGQPGMFGSLPKLDIDTAAGSGQGHGVVLSGGGIAVAWTQDVAVAATHTDIGIRVYDRLWVRRVFAAPVTAPYQHVVAPTLAQGNDGVLVMAWLEAPVSTYQVMAQRIGIDGQAHGPAGRVDGGGGGVAVGAPALAIRGGDGAIGVAWAGINGPNDEIQLRVLTPTGLPVGPVQRVDTLASTPRQPSMAGAADYFFVAWENTPTQIRGRAVYPTIDRNDAVMGSLCSGPQDAACPFGTTCAADFTGAQPRCHVPCALQDGTICPGGGICEQGACVYPP